jgi:hypothetical protein
MPAAPRAAYGRSPAAFATLNLALAPPRHVVWRVVSQVVDGIGAVSQGVDKAGAPGTTAAGPAPVRRDDVA